MLRSITSLVATASLLSAASFADFKAAPEDLFQGNDPKELNVADFNNDGKQDIVFVDGGTIKLLYQKSNKGISEYSARLDGREKQFRVASNAAHQSEEFTVSAWVKPSSNDGITHLLSNGGFIISINHRIDRLAIQLNHADGIFRQATHTGSAPKADAWTHIAASYSVASGKLMVAVNGELVIDDPYMGLALDPTKFSDLTIGNSDFGTTNVGVNGELDEVSYFNSALDQAGLLELYNYGAPTDLNSHSSAASLVSWWTMGDHELDNFNTQFGSAAILKDIVSGHDATPVATEGIDKVNEAP